MQVSRCACGSAARRTRIASDWMDQNGGQNLVRRSAGGDGCGQAVHETSAICGANLSPNPYAMGICRLAARDFRPLCTPVDNIVDSTARRAESPMQHTVAPLATAAGASARWTTRSDRMASKDTIASREASSDGTCARTTLFLSTRPAILLWICA
jgi:hypothetical protein